jgi:hypothetical protein
MVSSMEASEMHHLRERIVVLLSGNHRAWFYLGRDLGFVSLGSFLKVFSRGRVFILAVR